MKVSRVEQHRIKKSKKNNKDDVGNLKIYITMEIT